MSETENSTRSYKEIPLSTTNGDPNNSFLNFDAERELNSRNILIYPDAVISIFLTDKERIDLEKFTYEQRKDEYLQAHGNKYIALFNGQVIGEDADLTSLVKTVYNQKGDIPAYFPFVAKEEKAYKMVSTKSKSKSR